MPSYQVVEKDDFGTDWHVVRYDNAATMRYDTEADALKAAKEYVHRTNDTVLCSSDRQSGAEAFLVMGDGFFLGFADDGKDWFAKDGRGVILKDATSHLLEGKTQVTVRPVPGT